jgi:hypothetical protein
MFSGIRDFLRIHGVARDTQAQQGKAERRQRDGGAPEDAPAPEDDDTLFSIEAIRTMLTAEPPAAGQAEEIARILEGLRVLESQGIHNIPIRLGQSVLEAVQYAIQPTRGDG